jgi:DNA polymerase-3 subunit beta
MSTDEGRLRIAATNLEIGVTTWIDANIEEEGRITIDARLLGEFVNTLPAGPVDLSVDPTRLTLVVQAGRDSASINGIDAEDFPVIPSISEEGFTAAVNAQMLRDLISLVEFAAATDAVRQRLADACVR